MAKATKKTNGGDERAAAPPVSIDNARAAHDSAIQACEQREAAAGQAVVDADSAVSAARVALESASPDDAVARQSDLVRAEAAARQARTRAETVRAECATVRADAIALLESAATADIARAAIEARMAHQIELDAVAKAATEVAQAGKRELRALAEKYGTLPSGYVDAALTAARARTSGAPISRELAHGIVRALGQEHVLHSTGMGLHSEQLLTFGEQIDHALAGTLAVVAAERKTERDRKRPRDPYAEAHRELSDALELEQRLRIELEQIGNGKGRRELEQRHRTAVAGVETARENRNDARDRLQRNNPEEEQVSL